MLSLKVISIIIEANLKLDTTLIVDPFKTWFPLL